MSDYAETLSDALNAFGPASLVPTNSQLLEDGRILRLRSGYNVRELGGYKCPQGTTVYHRFLRSGATRSLTQDDLDILRSWGVLRVVDLRSFGESPRLSCRFAKQDWVTWENVALYDYDMSAPAMAPVRDIGGYFVQGYLNMLSSRKALAHLFEFFAEAAPNECILFHCAAGMDRTGVVSMLLLGLAGVSRRQIVADYAYSFGEVSEVDEVLDENGDAKASVLVTTHLRNRIAIIGTVYDTIIHEHGSVRAFLRSCDAGDETLDAVIRHLTQTTTTR